MNRWRPPARICVKALGLAWRDGRLLAAEVRDDAGRLKGVRPIGGEVEFGETARDAVVREFREELAIDIRAVGAPLVLENHYRHEGAVGHEVIFAFRVELPPGALAGPDPIVFDESDTTAQVARWFAPEDLDGDTGPALYPRGLKALIAPG